MSATYRTSAWASYRDGVTVLVEAGESFGDIEDAIDDADLSEDQKAALWLLAFAMRDPNDEQGSGQTVLPSIS